MSFLKKLNIGSNIGFDEINNTFTSPDDERSITILIAGKNRVKSAVFAHDHYLSSRGLIRFYTFLKQVRYGQCDCSKPVMIDYNIYAVYDYCRNLLHFFAHEFEVEKFTEDLLKVRYILDSKAEDEKKRKIRNCYGYSSEEYYNSVLSDSKFPALLASFELSKIISYTILQKEIVINFLRNILQSYSLYW